KRSLPPKRQAPPGRGAVRSEQREPPKAARARKRGEASGETGSPLASGGGFLRRSARGSLRASVGPYVRRSGDRAMRSGDRLCDPARVDLRELLESRRGESLETYARGVNPQFVK